MLPSFARETVIRIRPGTITRRGSVEPDWDTATEITIYGCSIQPGATSLSQDGRVLGISDGYTGYFPPDSDVLAGDKILFNGEAFQVIGVPREWESPSGRVSHMQAQLERWFG